MATLETLRNSIITSIYGRRLGLDSSEMLVGPKAIRNAVSTADTTAANLVNYGISRLTTAVSSGVYTLDAPAAGVEKRLVFDTTGANPIYVKTANNEYITSTQMTTGTVICSSQTAMACITLVGVSTSQWFVAGAISSGILKLSTST